MASLIPGYEYDVFISYRQNDNKYDGWVTTFVNNLTLELEATIKDKISVYFDINPHDGLLETHTVDRSLEDKLKCLIFIPIISKTYCDKNSFAWQHEFCTFNRMASEDKLGREIRLSRGNFASRILPVRIHELDPEDMLLIENELGSALRSVDFVFKAAGVNRPLRANEDHPHDNLNNTYYRDQINKVANAISEIIAVLRYESALKVAEEIKTTDALAGETGRDEKKGILKKTTYPTGSKIVVAGILIVALLSIVLKLIYPEGFKIFTGKGSGSNDKRISITVMPFRNLTNDSAWDYLTIGVQDWIVNNLSFDTDVFNVRPFELVRDALKSENVSDFSSITPYTGGSISRRLDAEVFLIGNIFKIGEKLRLNAQLISSESDEVIGTFQEEGVADNITNTIDSMSIKVRDHLLVSKIDKETYQSEPKNPYKSHFVTSSPEAFKYHILAKEALLNLDYTIASKLDSQAIAIDTGYVGAMVTLCWENFYYGRYGEAAEWLQKAYKKREALPPVQQISLEYQYALFFQTPEEQIKYLRQLQKLEDNNPGYYLLSGYLYMDLLKYDEAILELEKAQEMYKKIGMEPSDIFYYHYLLKAYNKTGRYKKGKSVLKRAENHFLKNQKESGTGDQYFKMALIYCDAGLYDKAEEHFKKGISLNPGNQGMIINYAYSIIDYNLNVDKGLELISTALGQDSTNGLLIDIKGWALYRQHKYTEALGLLEKAYQLLPTGEIKAHIDSVQAAINGLK